MSALKELAKEKKKTNFLCPIYSLNSSIHDLLLPHSLRNWISYLHLQSSAQDFLQCREITFRPFSFSDIQDNIVIF